jgi:hypothetical protein
MAGNAERAHVSPNVPIWMPMRKVMVRFFRRHLLTGLADRVRIQEQAIALLARVGLLGALLRAPSSRVAHIFFLSSWLPTTIPPSPILSRHQRPQGAIFGMPRRALSGSTNSVNCPATIVRYAQDWRTA